MKSKGRNSGGVISKKDDNLIVENVVNGTGHGVVDHRAVTEPDTIIIGFIEKAENRRIMFTVGNNGMLVGVTSRSSVKGRADGVVSDVKGAEQRGGVEKIGEFLVGHGVTKLQWMNKGFR